MSQASHPTPILPLEAGIVYLDETTIAHPRRGYIKLEDTVAVTATGHRHLRARSSRLEHRSCKQIDGRSSFSWSLADSAPFVPGAGSVVSALSIVAPATSAIRNSGLYGETDESCDS